MSEYQYYEFQAVDRPLTSRQMDELRTVSSRAQITPTSFTNFYSYGSFRGDEVEFLERYFDVHVYVANWGTHILMFGMPRTAVDIKALRAYQAEGGFSVLERGERVILTLESQNEGGGGWVEEGEGARWMASLLALREDILNGDYRAAYLGWLRGVQASGLDDEAEDQEDYEDEDFGALDRGSTEPPIPPGLGALTGTPRKLVEFLELDPDLLAVAATGSEKPGRAGPSTEAMSRWIGELPAAEKDDLLLRVMQGDAHLQMELRRRFREATASPPQVTTASRRTIRELLQATAAHRSERERREAEAKRQESARRAEEAARARDAYLKSLIGQESALWQQAVGAIERKLPKEYDRAVEILKDLRDLAAREGKSAAFGLRVGELRARYANRPALLERLTRARLP